MVVDASKKALTIRYSLLPYLYTLFWRAHSNGDTVARPVFFECVSKFKIIIFICAYSIFILFFYIFRFPYDNLTLSLDQQFMWGPYLMFVPILDPDTSSVKAYLPKELWYKFTTLSLLGWSGQGTLNEGETILIRGGGILPLQAPNDKKVEPINTSTLRSRPLQLVVALDSVSSAKGSLYWDDGESLSKCEY